jgi:hypothetical protein
VRKCFEHSGAFFAFFGNHRIFKSENSGTKAWHRFRNSRPKL